MYALFVTLHARGRSDNLQLHIGHLIRTLGTKISPSSLVLDSARIDNETGIESDE